MVWLSERPRDDPFLEFFNGIKEINRKFDVLYPLSASSAKHSDGEKGEIAESTGDFLLTKD
jgi:hypothetical protein